MKYLAEKVTWQDEHSDGETREEMGKASPKEIPDEVPNETPHDAEKDVMQQLARISELNVQTGIRYCLNREFYEEILKEYLQSDKAAELEDYYAAGDWSNYKIVVHALKSTSLTIGAVSLSEEAKALEMAAKNGDEDYIVSQHQAVMEKYRELRAKLGEILS